MNKKLYQNAAGSVGAALSTVWSVCGVTALPATAPLCDAHVDRASKALRPWVLALSFLLLISGCATQKEFSGNTSFGQTQPASVLVLPPLNLSPDVRGTYSLLSTVTYPLAESGYYVFPVALVDQTFRENGVEAPGDMHDIAPPKLAEIFGTDAVLYLVIEEYGAKYRVIDSAVVVTARGRLVDARTGQLLWEGKASASSAEGRDRSYSSLAGMLISTLIEQVSNSMGDQGYPIARRASHRLLATRPGGLPPGPRSLAYQKTVGR